MWRKAGQFSELSVLFLQIKHIEYVDQNPTGRSSRSNWLRISKHYPNCMLKKTIKKAIKPSIFL
jgi:hypothetical protein